MYVIKNISRGVITLSDLHVVLNPGEEIDLSLAARREDILRSRDLARVRKTHKVQITSKMTPPAVPVSARDIDEHDLKRIIREVLSEQKPQDLGEVLSQSLSPIMNMIEQKIKDIPLAPRPEEPVNDSLISPEALAELQSQVIGQMKDKIQTNQPKPQQKIRIDGGDNQNIASRL